MLKLVVLVINLTVTPLVWSIVNGYPVVDELESQTIFPLVVSRQPLYDLLTISLAKLSQHEICTGVAISDTELITAGHCVRSESAEALFVSLVHWDKVLERYRLIHPLSHVAFYDQRDDQPINPGAICPKYPYVLPNAHFADLAIIKFRPFTFSKWHRISQRRDILTNGATITFYGYGISENPFFGSSRLLLQRETPKLRKGRAKIWEVVQQRMGWLSFLHESYAADGDSGGPVFFQDQLIGNINSVSEYCSDATGSDYAILNTVS